MLRKLTANKKYFIPLALLVVVVGVFLFGNEAQAWVTDVLGWIAAAIVWALGKILILLVRVLIYIAQYNGFITSGAVANGWVIVRDLCNMFFVIVLLIISFATILHVESYNYKKWLPKLVLMAILINFSKTICGLIIDFGQVVMLTFVNAFKDIGGGNLTSMLGITEWASMKDNGTNISDWEVTAAYFLAVIYVIISVVVIATMIAMLVMRMVMIWVYVVLSPAAYLLAAFPGGQKYSSQWWSEFTKNVIVGPVLCFFIWLSFVTITPDKNAGAVLGMDPIIEKESISSQSGNNTAGSFGAADLMVKFIISIGMLIGGLKIASEIGGAAGSMAGKGMSKINKMGLVAGGAVGGFALGRAKAVGRTARNTGLYGASKLSQGLGSVADKTFGKDNKIATTLKAGGNIGLAWRSDMQAANKKKKVASRQKFLEKMGMGENTMDKTSEFLKTDTGKEFSAATKIGGAGAAVGSVLGGGVGAAVGGFLVGGAVSKLGGVFKKKYSNKADAKMAEVADLKEDAAALRAAGDAEQAGEFERKAQKIENSAKRAQSKSKFFGSVQSFTSEITQKAAAKGSVDIKNARQNVKGAASNVNDFMDSASGGTFYSASGSGQPKKFMEQLALDAPEAAAARANIAQWVGNLDPATTSKHDLGILKGLARGIAAAKKGGMDTGNLGDIISAINDKNSIGGKDGLKGATVDSLTDNVVSYRSTGQEGERGSGELAVNTLAGNDKGQEGYDSAKNIIGVDFAKLKEAGVDIDAEAEGANVSGAQMVSIANAVIGQIDVAQSDLKTALDNGEITSAEFESKNSELEKAKAKLSNPEELENLSMVNTGGKNFGRQERMATVYHEEIHKGGVDDEELTENMARSLMDNKLYGRNAESGGRHATELAQMAKGMKDSGASNEDIMKQVDKEIQERLKKEGANRAARVIKMESGEKETVEEVVSTDNKEEDAVAVNTEELQSSLDELSAKFKNLQVKAPTLAKSTNFAGMSPFAFSALMNKIFSKGFGMLAKKSSTPLEADILVQLAGEQKKADSEEINA